MRKLLALFGVVVLLALSGCDQGDLLGSLGSLGTGLQTVSTEMAARGWDDFPETPLELAAWSTALYQSVEVARHPPRVSSLGAMAARPARDECGDTRPLRDLGTAYRLAPAR